MARSYEMPLGMFWKKMYCSQCGKRLITRKKSSTYTRDDPEFKTFLSWHIISVFSYTEVTYTYYCPTCRREISYIDQLDVEKAQKKLGRKTVSAEEIPDGHRSRQRRTNLLAWVFGIVMFLLAVLITWYRLS